MSGDVNGSRNSGSGIRNPAFGARDERVLAEVDRELRAALSVSPSADFEARVLARVAERVAEEDVPSNRSYYGWLAVAAGIVLVAGLFYALSRPSTAARVAPPQMADRRPDVVLPPALTQPMPARDTRAHVREPAAPASRPLARRAEPDVIVPPNQMEAVRRLVRAVNEGRIEVQPEPSRGPLETPAEIVVQPLIVNPIPVPALDMGATPPNQPSRGA